MRWGKVVLIFQAVITLILGIAFFTQVISVNDSNLKEFSEDLKSGTIPTNTDIKLEDIKNRYTTAAYILLIISIIEIVIIIRLFS